MRTKIFVEKEARRMEPKCCHVRWSQAGYLAVYSEPDPCRMNATNGKDIFLSRASI